LNNQCQEEREGRLDRRQMTRVTNVAREVIGPINAELDLDLEEEEDLDLMREDDTKNHDQDHEVEETTETDHPQTEEEGMTRAAKT